MRQQPCRKLNRKLGVTYVAWLAKTRGKKIADTYAKHQLEGVLQCSVQAEGAGKVAARSS